MPPLDRTTCPVCKAHVPLRVDGELREHRDHRHPMYGVSGAVREGKVPLCPASGNNSSEQMCRECGCTDARACDGGCYWAEVALCSECAEPAIA